MCLPSNNPIAAVVHCDLDLRFQDQQFPNVNISKTVRARANMRDMTLIWRLTFAIEWYECGWCTP